MTGNEPLLPIPFVREGVASLNLSTGLCERKRVQAGVNGSVAVDLYDAHVDAPVRLVLEKVVKVIFLLFGRDPRLVGDGCKEDRLGRIVRSDLVWITSLERAVPAIKQRGDLRFACRGADFCTLRDLACRRWRGRARRKQQGGDEC